MDSKVSSIVITSVLAFALIAGVPAVFENVLAQQDGGGQSGSDAGMDQGQSGSNAGMAQGNNTGFAQTQPGTDMGGMTQDQSNTNGDSNDGGNDGNDNEDSEDKN